MLEQLARLGYASKAVVYAIIGVLAILTALRRGGRITDTSGALRVVLTQPYGRILLVVLAVGILGYALWRLLDAVFDPEGHGTGVKGLIARTGNAFRGLIYGALGLEAIRLVRGLGSSGGDDTELWIARIMEWPLGGLLVGIVGLVVIAFGTSEIRDSVIGKRDAKLDLSAFGPGTRPTIEKISRLGVGVRGALIATLGVFLVRAALQHDPSEAAGSRESMIRLAGVAEGRWLLAFIAVGVLAYAVDQAVHARCRRIKTPV